MIWLIPRVLSYSAFLLAPFLAPGDVQERTLGMRLRGRLLKGRGERVNTQACENETDAHDVRRPVVTQCMNSTLGRRLAVGQMVNWFIIAPHQNS